MARKRLVLHWSESRCFPHPIGIGSYGMWSDPVREVWNIWPPQAACTRLRPILLSPSSMKKIKIWLFPLASGPLSFERGKLSRLNTKMVCPGISSIIFPERLRSGEAGERSKSILLVVLRKVFQPNKRHPEKRMSCDFWPWKGECKRQWKSDMEIKTRFQSAIWLFFLKVISKLIFPMYINIYIQPTEH